MTWKKLITQLITTSNIRLSLNNLSTLDTILNLYCHNIKIQELCLNCGYYTNKYKNCHKFCDVVLTQGNLHGKESTYS